jgi:hypothetical protein
LSPQICCLQASDATIRGFVVKTQDPKGDFKSFLLLGFGQSVSVDATNRSFFLSVSQELRNDELRRLIVTEIGDELTLSNAASRVRLSVELAVDCSREIEFVSSHLPDLDASRLKDLDSSTWSAIFSCKSLKIASEDWLCRLILELVDGDRENFSLFEYVQFQFISAEVATRFINVVLENIDLVGLKIWMNLGRRFVMPVASRMERRGTNFSVNARFDGIVRFVTSPSAVLAVTDSSECDESVPATAVAHLGDSGDYFESEDIPDS